MTQTILNGNEIKIETAIERLYKLRTEYYLELMNEMCELRQKRINLIQQFKLNIIDIDNQIEIEYQRNKISHKELQSINKRIWK